MNCEAMFDTFGSFSSFFKAKKSYIDSPTFRLHYRTTFAILVSCRISETSPGSDWF